MNATGQVYFSMKKKATAGSDDQGSPFKGLEGIEYFKFEEDFIEENVRCIPMIVRFKMDAAGIKLKLAEWSRFSVEERKKLALLSCSNKQEATVYYRYLKELVRKYTGAEATDMEIEAQPAWAEPYTIPEALAQRAKGVKREISMIQWRGLTHLQRFALLKLCRPGHESKNFLKALKEFNIRS